MISCYDMDGVITADPEFYRCEMRGLRARGHQVHILTGNPTALHRLAEMGFVKGREYDALGVVPRQHIAVAKVAYMKSVGATHLVDNRRKTIRAVRKAGFTGHWHASPKES